ncbi:unnamed protein product [Sphagnum tenellum]
MELVVKLLTQKSHQGIDDFLNEVVSITNIKHKNLVTLKGVVYMAYNVFLCMNLLKITILLQPYGYATFGQLSTKLDVYNFGILLLEIAWSLHKNNNLSYLIDQKKKQYYCGA